MMISKIVIVSAIVALLIGGYYYIKIQDSISADQPGMRLVGDVNGDGKIDEKDAKLIQDVLDGKAPKPADICPYDVNKNGYIDPSDVAIIMRYVVGVAKISGSCK